MTLTDKHIENAHVCARLELAGASVNKIAKGSVSFSPGGKGPIFGHRKSPEFGTLWNASMTLTDKHIECAHLCARLEVAGIQDTKRMAAECGVARATIYNWFLQGLRTRPCGFPG